MVQFNLQISSNLENITKASSVPGDNIRKATGGDLDNITKVSVLGEHQNGWIFYAVSSPGNVWQLSDTKR
jgi:hypothetical protein